jgi:hypothetical protein
MNSAILNNVETFIYGLDHDSNLNAPNSQRLTSIEHAISHCSIDCFLLLLAHPRLVLPRNITLLAFLTDSTSMFSLFMLLYETELSQAIFSLTAQQHFVEVMKICFKSIGISHPLFPIT